MNQTHLKYHSQIPRKGIYYNSVKLLLASSIFDQMSHWLAMKLVSRTGYCASPDGFVLISLIFQSCREGGSSWVEPVLKAADKMS